MGRFAEARSLNDIRPGDIIEWNATLHGGRAARGTIVQKRSALRSFLQYLDTFEEDAHAAQLLRAMDRLSQPPASQPRRQTFALTQRRVIALNNCRNSARVLAETLTEPLRLEGARAGAERPAVARRPGRRRERAEERPARRRAAPEAEEVERPAFAGVPRERMPTVPEVQAIRLPENWSVRTAPRIARHFTYLMEFIPTSLAQVPEAEREAEREAAREQWETAITEQLAVIRGAAESWGEAALERLEEEEAKDSPDEERVERLTEQVETLVPIHHISVQTHRTKITVLSSWA